MSTTKTYFSKKIESHSSSLTFDIIGKKLIETKIGANITDLDLPDLPAWTALCTALGLQTYYYTPISAGMSAPDAVIINNFLTATGSDVAIYYPIQSDAVEAAFPVFIDWLDSTFSPVLIQLDQESQEGAGLTNAEYISRSQQVIAHIPLIKCSWDLALIYKNNAISLNRNIALSTLTDTDYGRQYLQISPDRIVFTADQDANLVLVNYYFDTLLPEDLVKMASRLPNVTKQVISQWHNEDAGGNFMSDKPLGNYTIGRTVQWVLSHTDKYAYLFWMNMGNLLTNTPSAEPEYTSILRVVPAFNFLYTIPIYIVIAGCTLQGFWNGVNNWGIIITNSTAIEHNILQSDISFPSKTISTNFTRNTGWALTWDSVQVNETAVDPFITIRPYSVSWVTFSTT